MKVAPHESALVRRECVPEDGEAPVVHLDGVGFHYAGGPDVLRDLAVELRPGSFHFLSGPSGAGKTTLLRLILLALKPSRGFVRLFGRETGGLTGAELTATRRRMGVVFQDFRLLDHLTTYQNVALPLVVQGYEEASFRGEVVELLQWVGLGDRINALPPLLSGGEKQRAALARALIARPELILADEPTGNVDPPLARRLLHLFVELNRLGTSVVIATHDVALMDQVDAGRLILADGHLFHDPDVPDPDQTPAAPVGHHFPIVPADGRASGSLVALIAVLAFLAATAAGSAALVAARSAEWRAEIARAATLQLRPLAGRDVEADLVRAAAIARATPGIAAARILSRADAERLLEPWLGRGLDLADLPVPRLVALEVDRAAGPGRVGPDLAGLSGRLSAEVPGATLDDHGAWRAQISRAADAVVAVAVAAVALVLAASAGAIGFATRAAVSAHRDAVEVLHYVGADDRFIVRQFARRFARLGLVGGLIGSAAGAFALALGSAWLARDAAAAASGIWAYAACLAVALADGAVAAWATGRAVRQVLRGSRTT